VLRQLTYLLTYLLTPWCRVLLEKLVKKFPALHGTRRFITALTSVRHLSLSWASPIQSTYPHPTSWRSIVILSTHLRLGLPSGLLPSGFPSKTLYTLLLLRLQKKIAEQQIVRYRVRLLTSAIYRNKDSWRQYNMYHQAHTLLLTWPAPLYATTNTTNGLRSG